MRRYNNGGLPRSAPVYGVAGAGGGLFGGHVQQGHYRARAVTRHAGRPLVASVKRACWTGVLGTAIACALPLSTAWACDGERVGRAERAERAHRLGDAIARRTALLDCPAAAWTVANRLALAEDHASLGEFARAAELIEQAAVEAPRDARVVAAMGTAAGYRVALGDTAAAGADARWLLGETGPSEASVERAFEVGAALEGRQRWSEASQWYDALARRFPARAQWAVQARALVGLGRAYEALGDLGSAARSWQAAHARWPAARDALGIEGECASARTMEPGYHWEEPPPVRYVSGGGGMMGGASGIVSPYGGVPYEDAEECVGRAGAGDIERRLSDFAEARLRLMRLAVDRCLVLDPGLYPAPTERRAYDGWAGRRFTPMLRRWSGCLEEATERFADVLRLRVARWDLAADALIAGAYLRYARTVREAPVPSDVWRNRDLSE